MKRTLIVSATLLEIKPLLERLGLDSLFAGNVTENYRRGPGNFDVLISGVGQMQTAYWLASMFARENYSAALNFGIAGSFRDSLPKCAVVRVESEELADLGAEDGEQNLDLFEMKLLNPDLAPFSKGALRGPHLLLRSLEHFAPARSITVNRVLGSETSIRKVVADYDPDVVNMEGAAFFYACSLANIPCASIRSISDRVAPRDKRAWDIPGAVRALCDAAAPIIAELS